MSAAPATSRTRTPRGARPWWVLGLVEVALAVSVVVLDLLIPTVVLLALMVVSLLVRRQGPAQVGLRRPDRVVIMVGQVLALSLVWTILVFTLITPAVEHLAGRRRDVSAFATLEGNLSLLVILVLLSWTLAAFGEEVAYRGYLLTRSAELFARLGPGAPIAAVALSSVTFGLAHTEQGVVGVVLTTVDGLMLCVLRYHYGTVLASVIAHGTVNTIGMTAYYLSGPVPALHTVALM